MSASSALAVACRLILQPTSGAVRLRRDASGSDNSTGISPQTHRHTPGRRTSNRIQRLGAGSAESLDDCWERRARSVSEDMEEAPHSSRPSTAMLTSLLSCRLLLKRSSVLTTSDCGHAAGWFLSSGGHCSAHRLCFGTSRFGNSNWLQGTLILLCLSLHVVDAACVLFAECRRGGEGRPQG
eukprot:1398490-Pleurochrysis_carterae.AAC.1